MYNISFSFQNYHQIFRIRQIKIERKWKTKTKIKRNNETRWLAIRYLPTEKMKMFLYLRGMSVSIDSSTHDYGYYNCCMHSAIIQLINALNRILNVNCWWHGEALSLYKSVSNLENQFSKFVTSFSSDFRDDFGNSDACCPWAHELQVRFPSSAGICTYSWCNSYVVGLIPANTRANTMQWRLKYTRSSH